MRRRDFLALPAAAAAPDEDDSANIKLAHRVSARISDDDLKFKHDFAEKFSANKHQDCVLAADNETKMCVMFRDAFPGAIVVRFQSAQSQDVEFDGFTLSTWEFN